MVHGADLNAKTNFGYTALTESSTLKDLDIFRLLIETGADVNSTMYNNLTLLMQMASIGDAIIVKMLVDAKANVDLVDKFGKTALMIAVQKGN